VKCTALKVGLESLLGSL